MSNKTEKYVSLISQLAAEFLNYHSNGASLITVTNCTISDDLKRSTIYITVFPDDKEADALNFAKRQRAELRDFIKGKAKLGVLPFLEVEIDKGEKARQRIDELINKG